MKLVFVYWGYENAGSMLDLRGYARAAKAMGHEMIVYGPPNPRFALDYSQDLAGADAVIFVFEWTTSLQLGDRLDWTRLIEAVPRHRRIVIDCDGAYNDPIEFNGDYNHRSEASSPYWTEVCDSLSDKIFQPTLRPRRRTSDRSCSTSTTRPGRRPSISPTRNSAWSMSATPSSAGAACRRCCAGSKRYAIALAASPWWARVGSIRQGLYAMG